MKFLSQIQATGSPAREQVQQQEQQNQLVTNQQQCTSQLLQQTSQQNSYVYVECVPDPLHDTRQFDLQTAPLHQPQITYNNGLPQISNFMLQNLQIPATVQFQTYNVPMQLPGTLLLII